MRKVIVEFELDDSYTAYLPNDQERIESLINPRISGMKFKIIKSEDDE